MRFTKCVGGLAAIATLSSVAGPAIARNDETIVLDASSPWNLDMAEESCALRRAFSSDGVNGWLEFRRYSPSPGFEMKIIVNGLELSKAGADLKFVPDDEFDDFSKPPAVEFDNGITGFFVQAISLRQVRERRKIHYDRKEAFESDMSYDPPRWAEDEQAERAAQISALEVRNGFEMGLRFEIGSMEHPMEALDACMDGLLKTWGIDPEIDGNLVRSAKFIKPREFTRKLVRNFDRRFLRPDQDASVRVRLAVDAKGRVSECAIQTESVDLQFKNETCRKFRKEARFKPSLDASGNPVKGHFFTTMTFIMN